MKIGFLKYKTVLAKYFQEISLFWMYLLILEFLKLFYYRMRQLATWEIRPEAQAFLSEQSFRSLPVSIWLLIPFRLKLNQVVFGLPVGLVQYFFYFPLQSFNCSGFLLVSNFSNFCFELFKFSLRATILLNLSVNTIRMFVT